MKKLSKFLIAIIPQSEKYITDIKLRTELFLKLGLIINVGYATFNIFTGVFYRSVWFGAVAVYYIMLCFIKFFLIIRGFEQKQRHPYADFFACGIMLLLLSVSITAIIFLMILQNKSYLYGRFVIYASAAYTIFRISAALYDTVKFRRIHSPVLQASKALSLSVALMSLFSLQSSILDLININSEFKQCLNILTGSIVGASTIAIALSTIVKAKRLLNKEKRS